MKFLAYIQPAYDGGANEIAVLFVVIPEILCEGQ